MDAFNRMMEILKDNPNATSIEITEILINEGFTVSHERISKFMKLTGLED